MLLSTRLPGLQTICWMAALAAGLFAHTAQAQTVPSATRTTHALWVGGEYSNISAGFPYASGQRLQGAGAFVDYHLTSHIGVEAEVRFLRFNSFYGETEDHYLAGPRYMARSFGRLQPYAQFLVGEGRIQYPFGIGSGNYLALAPAAGANYRISSRWSLRGEYEFQFWPGSPNFVNEPAHRITPQGIHAGIAYRLFR
jgi:opacity protein-like surface antigen